MAREKLPPPLLKNMIHDILSELSKDEFYPTEMQKAFKDCTQVKVSHFHVIYKGCIKCLTRMTREVFMKNSIHLCHYKLRHS